MIDILLLSPTLERGEPKYLFLSALGEGNRKSLIPVSVVLGCRASGDRCHDWRGFVPVESSRALAG